MREFNVLIEMAVPAATFAKAEQAVHKVMTEAFNATKGEMPTYFNTLAIYRGPKMFKKDIDNG